MARPKKTGLDYFPFDVDYYDDFKIMDLLNEYGPLGTTIYEVIISKIYKNGYYLEVPLDKLATQIVRIIGNRWIKNKDLVIQVIQYCADIGLFDNALLTQSVITSVGIQRRYSEVTVRNKVDKSKYWLLEKDKIQTALEDAPENRVSAIENEVFTAETKVNTTLIPQKEIKENKSKVKESKEENISADADIHSQQYGRYKNVYLTKDEFATLKSEFPTDYSQRIERLSEYIASSGKKYQSHLATIRSWARNDKEKSQGESDRKSSFDVEDLKGLSMFND